MACWRNSYSPAVFGREHRLLWSSTGKPVEVQKIPLYQKVVYFKAECNFTNRKDVADFFYSLDGKRWVPLGTQLKMTYTFPQFMGYRFVLFNYATKNIGGSADFDFFHITYSISREK